MGERKRKSTQPAADDLIVGLRRQEIEADAFELWLGISRLLARVTTPDRRRPR
jgi:hypothetical protein